MVDLHEKLKSYRERYKIIGNRPVYIKVDKSKKHNFKGNYLLTDNTNELYFSTLNWFTLGYTGKNDFVIPYSDIKGFRLKFYEYNYRKMIVYLKDNDEISFRYLYDCKEAFDNEANINAIIKLLKEKGIPQLSNQKKGDSNEQRKISKFDQAFTQEVRAPKGKR